VGRTKGTEFAAANGGQDRAAASPLPARLRGEG
jgi:hypothetical protein